jgi:hypothetical protein
VWVAPYGRVIHPLRQRRAWRNHRVLEVASWRG